jgi:hypothetical protein
MTLHSYMAIVFLVIPLPLILAPQVHSSHGTCNDNLQYKGLLKSMLCLHFSSLVHPCYFHLAETCPSATFDEKHPSMRWINDASSLRNLVAQGGVTFDCNVECSLGFCWPPSPLRIFLWGFVIMLTVGQDETLSSKEENWRGNAFCFC